MAMVQSRLDEGPRMKPVGLARSRVTRAWGSHRVPTGDGSGPPRVGLGPLGGDGAGPDSTWPRRPVPGPQDRGFGSLPSP